MPDPDPADDADNPDNAPASDDDEPVVPDPEPKEIQCFYPPTLLVPSALGEKMTSAFFFLLTNADPCFEPLNDVRVEKIPLEGTDYVLIRSQSELLWSARDLVAYSTMLARIPALVGLIPWIFTDPGIGIDPLVSSESLSSMVRDVLVAQDHDEGTYVRLYFKPEAFVSPPRINMGPLKANEAMNIFDAEALFNKAGLLPRYDDCLGALTAYVAPDGTQFWPCDVDDETQRNQLFTRHWCVRYDVARELEKKGLLDPNDVITHHGQYYESSCDHEALARNPKVVVKIGSCGVGKSSSCWKMVAQRIAANKPTHVACISIRDSQGDDMVRAAREASIGILGPDKAIVLTRHKAYDKNNAEEYRSKDFVECSVESAFKLRGWIDKHPGFILVLDELPEILAILATSQTVLNRDLSAEILVNLVRKAGTVIVMSADMRALHVCRVLEWLPQEVLDPEENKKVVLLDIQVPEQQTKVIVPVRSIADCKARLADLLRAGTSVTVACLSRKLADELELMCNDLGVRGVKLTQYSDDKSWVKARGQDLEETPFFVYTPTVGTGVSIDIPEHFSYCMLFCNQGLSVDSHLQAIGRVRDVATGPCRERIIYVCLPDARTNTNDTSPRTIREQWRAAAETNARRQDIAVEPEHPVLFPLQVDAESLKLTDWNNFVPRFYSEARRCGYSFQTDVPLRRVTRIEEARALVKNEAHRVEKCLQDVKAMIELEQDEETSGNTYKLLVEKRKKRNVRAANQEDRVELSEIEKQYLKLGESIRRLKFNSLTEVNVEDFCLALWGSYDLDARIETLWKFEEAKQELKAKAQSNNICPYSRDAALRIILPMLGLSSMRAKTLYWHDAQLSPDHRAYLVELVTDFPRQFKPLLEAELQAICRAQKIKYEPPEALEVPSPCCARLALQFANELLKPFGVTLQRKKVGVTKFPMDERLRPKLALDVDPGPKFEQIKNAARGAKREKSKAKSMYALEADESIRLMYAILARSPAASQQLRDNIAVFLEQSPLEPHAGEAIIRARLVSAEKSLGVLEGNIHKMLQRFTEENGPGPRRHFKRQQESEPLRLDSSKRTKGEDLD